MGRCTGIYAKPAASTAVNPILITAGTLGYSLIFLFFPVNSVDCF